MTIFTTILGGFLNKFEEKLTNMAENMTEGTIELFHEVTNNLLPTPDKSHYLFNLRDISKVFQGIYSVIPKEVYETKQLVRLWSHECIRVYKDRLVSESDRKWFDKMIFRYVINKFNEK